MNTIITMKTSVGDIHIRLFDDRAPKTVENFLGLATGKKSWKNPETGKQVEGKSLYIGTFFHRCIPGFMIQGGDPMGTGTGGPGYRFEDEFHQTLKFDRPGLLAMANAGPGTNGSQFFITVAATSWLNNKHTIFGEVIEGMNTIDKIIKAPKGAQDRPTTPVTIDFIEVNDK